MIIRTRLNVTSDVHCLPCEFQIPTST